MQHDRELDEKFYIQRIVDMIHALFCILYLWLWVEKIDCVK